MILEVACTWEPLILEREREKKGKYQELAADLARQLPGFKIRVVPVVLGDLGAVGGLRRHLEESQLFTEKQIVELV